MQYQAYDQEFIDKYYSQVDENGERYQSADLTSPSYRPNLIYTYKGYKPGKNGWAVSKEKMAEMDRQGRILFPKSKDGRLRRKNFLKDQKGLPINNLWLDIGNVQKESLEGTGWPTQKPVALLERVISLSSNEGDVVFDCFAGCGTSMHAAHNLKRKWIGIDISPTAIRVNKKRLEDIGAKVEVVDEKDLEVKLGHKSAQKNQKAA
jgi:DNA modification methylase